MPRLKLKATPVLKKKKVTAYEVCEFVEQRVKEEPARLNMAEWRMYFKSLDIVERGFYGFETWDDKYEKLGNAPGCGTVACLAGWIGTVTLNNPWSADAVLTLIGDESSDEWSPEHTNLKEELKAVFYTIPEHEAGTKTYAREALKPFRAFMNRNKKFLQTRILYRQANGRYSDVLPTKASVEVDPYLT